MCKPWLERLCKDSRKAHRAQAGFNAYEFAQNFEVRRFIMTSTARTQSVRVDQFFTGTEARFDRWRSLLQAARRWERVTSQEGPGKEDHLASVSKSFQELLDWEDFFAYPGPALLKALNERITSRDATGTARLTQSISTALLTHSYRTNLGDWESEDQAPIGLASSLPGAGDEAGTYRPYFEVLVVSSAQAGTWSGLAQELRNLRRPQDKFVYESVFASSFEDAMLAAILNGSIEAVIIAEGFPFGSSHDSPTLRGFLAANLAGTGLDTSSGQYGLLLANGLKRLTAV